MVYRPGCGVARLSLITEVASSNSGRWHGLYFISPVTAQVDPEREYI